MTDQQIKDLVQKNIEDIKRNILDFPWENKRVYSVWCSQTYKFVSHSAPLIKRCADRLPEGHLKNEMNEHYNEEVGHEKFAARDAEFFGIDVEKMPSLPATDYLFGGIYDEIDADPAAMFGYAFALENVSKEFGPIVAKKVLEAYGIDASPNHLKNVPASFLTLHAEVDQEHCENGFECLDHLGDKQRETLVKVMLATFDNYKNYLRGILDYCEKNPSPQQQKGAQA